MELTQGLIEIARAAGLEIKPGEKRGEVILLFPRGEGRDPLSLRLSRIKAVELVLWLYVNRASHSQEEVEQ